MRRAQRVAPDDCAFGKALRARGANEIGRQHLEHRRALIARDARHGQQRQRCDRENEMLEPVDERLPRSHVVVHDVGSTMPPAGRIAPPVGEGEQNHQRAPEIGKRIEQQQHARTHSIEPTSAARRLQHADDAAEHEARARARVR